MAGSRNNRNPGRYKRRLQRRIAGVLLALFLLYSMLFIPSALFDDLQALGIAWVEWLARAGIPISFMFLVKWILFSQDSLANGQSKWSRFFRAQFPAQTIISSYECSKAEANALWFEYFNNWEFGNGHYPEYHRMTFERTYSCRLIYYLRQWLLGFTILGGATLVFLRVQNVAFSNWTPALMAIGLALAIWMYLTICNRIPRKNGDSETASGCWRKYVEISEIQKVHLRQNILKRASTYAKAWELAKESAQVDAGALSTPRATHG